MNKKTNTPSIRFKGYADAWEQRKLGDITYYATSSLKVSDSINEGKYDLYDANSIIGKTNSNVQSSDYVTIIKDGSGVGTVRLLPKNTSFIGTMGAILAKNEEIDFLFVLLQRFDFSQHINGATIPHVYYSEYKQDLVYVPTEIEQRRTGQFFKHLDNLITLHQRKCDKFKNIKTALLEKMFPHNGGNIPQIRFKGFTDAWEQRKLGDEAEEILAGGDIDKNLISGSGIYPVIANAITNDGIVGFYENSYRVKAPAVTVTGRGDVGHAQARKVNFTPVVRLLSIKSSHNVDFLENAINRGEVIIESTGVPQLTVPQISNRSILFPQTVLEEEKIGKLLSKLDNLITLHQQKVEKLKNIKTALLEKMFV